jgi:hypothetical protein
MLMAVVAHRCPRFQQYHGAGESPVAGLETEKSQGISWGLLLLIHQYVMVHQQYSPDGK